MTCFLRRVSTKNVFEEAFLKGSCSNDTVPSGQAKSLTPKLQLIGMSRGNALMNKERAQFSRNVPAIIKPCGAKNYAILHLEGQTRMGAEDTNPSKRMCPVIPSTLCGQASRRSRGLSR